MKPERELVDAVRACAEAAGLGGVRAIEPLERGGGNNRAFRVRARDGDAFLKQYFRDASDPRDRLGAETAFLRFAQHAGCDEVPRLLAADPAHGIALLTWIDGRRLAARDVGECEVNAALDLLARLNAARAQPGAQALAAASEACFSVAEHLETVERRVASLAGQAEEPARSFARTRLVPAWARVAENVRGTLAAAGADPASVLGQAQRCLSPSDFGFHNALARDDGRLVFHDFEYAGWDDPAKLAGDFFAQVAVPVPESFADGFMARLGDMLGTDEHARLRIAMLRPVYRIKWCCIVLGEFLPAGNRRRSFAQHDSGDDTDAAELRKLAQLGKAAGVLDAMAER